MKNKMRYKDETFTVTLKKTLLVINCLERAGERAREENAERGGGGGDFILFFIFLFCCEINNGVVQFCYREREDCND